MATIAIMKEVGVGPEVVSILENSGSSKLKETVEGDNWYTKICTYSDLRVAPYGVVSVDERFDDVIERYKNRKHELADIGKTEMKRQYTLVLEKQIQEKSSDDLHLIDDEMIVEVMEDLKTFSL